MMGKKDKEKLIETKAICKNRLFEDCHYCDVKDICKPLLNGKLPKHWGSPSVGKRWRADEGEAYYYVDGIGELNCRYEYNRSKEDYLYHSHNYFRTREEAEKYARVLETEMLLRKFADDNNPTTIDWNDTDEQKKFYLVYSRTINKLLYLSTYDGCEARAVYFTSSEVVQQAIEAIGKDRLMEYLAYEW